MINIGKKKIYLTFDMDWAIDEVIEYTLKIIEEENVSATFFVTHNTSLIDEMSANKDIELGIYSSFN